MIILMRSIKVRMGKGEKAVNWAKEINKYINEKFPGKKIRLLQNRFGSVTDIIWIGDFDSLSDLDNWQNKLGADDGYNNKIQEVWEQKLFLDGSTEDQVLISVD